MTNQKVEEFGEKMKREVRTNVLLGILDVLNDWYEYSNYFPDIKDGIRDIIQKEEVDSKFSCRYMKWIMENRNILFNDEE